MAFIFCRDRYDKEQFVNMDRVYSVSASPQDSDLYRFYTTPDQSKYILAKISADELSSHLERDREIMKEIYNAIVSVAQELADGKNPPGN